MSFIDIFLRYISFLKLLEYLKFNKVWCPKDCLSLFTSSNYIIINICNDDFTSYLPDIYGIVSYTFPDIFFWSYFIPSHRCIKNNRTKYIVYIHNTFFSWIKTILILEISYFFFFNIILLTTYIFKQIWDRNGKFFVIILHFYHKFNIKNYF